jgi:hypothetical protein
MCANLVLVAELLVHVLVHQRGLAHPASRVTKTKCQCKSNGLHAGTAVHPHVLTTKPEDRNREAFSHARAVRDFPKNNCNAVPAGAWR